LRRSLTLPPGAILHGARLGFVASARLPSTNAEVTCGHPNIEAKRSGGKNHHCDHFCTHKLRPLKTVVIASTRCAEDCVPRSRRRPTVGISGGATGGHLPRTVSTLPVCSYG